MAFDFKKEYKEYYLPPQKPQIVNIPTMQYVAVRGKGDPNEEGGAYKDAVGVLYAVSYTIKMSKMGDHRINGYFDYVVPPLEGFWWQDGVNGFDYADKSSLNWISAIRLPDFVTQEDFDWAVAEATRKKKINCSRAELLKITEGECVQIMHIGSYDDEPVSVAFMDDFLQTNHYQNDLTPTRLHHEIYLSDPRKTAVEKLKTVIRHPVKIIPSITPATASDLPEILTLQYLAYQSEAALFGTKDIPPLRQTLDEVVKEFEEGTILKLVINNNLIIGSIRAKESDGTVYIGKLMVHPDYQKHGYGTMLLNEIEKYYPSKRYELFTSTRSTNNIRLYQKNGYKEFARKAVDGELEFVFMEKFSS